MTAPAAGPPLFDRIGAEPLRAVLRDFYQRVFADPMIGFLFAGKNQERLIQKEWELTAALLGADVRYTGRPMTEAHAAVPILGGHFDRRTRILEETLADHGVDPEVQAAWLGHARALRRQLASDRDSECGPGP
jgi:hemoglobin